MRVRLVLATSALLTFLSLTNGGAQTPPTEPAAVTSPQPTPAVSTKVGTKDSLWLFDLDAGKAQAHEASKNLLVITSADWCPDCRRLSAKILTKPSVRKFLSKNYICVKLPNDSGAGAALMKEHDTKVIPTLFVFNAHGVFINKAPAEHVTPRSFVKLVSDLSSKKRG